MVTPASLVGNGCAQAVPAATLVMSHKAEISLVIAVPPVNLMPSIKEADVYTTTLSLHAER